MKGEKIMKKMRKIKMTTWRKRTSGEKVLSVIITLIKLALIIAAVVTVAGVVFAIGFGIFAAFAIVNAISGGFEMASNAYKSGDIYVRFK